jgi:hypothetical protein
LKTLITGLSAAALWKTLKLPGPCYGGREGQGVGEGRGWAAAGRRGSGKGTAREARGAARGEGVGDGLRTVSPSAKYIKKGSGRSRCGSALPFLKVATCSASCASAAIITSLVLATCTTHRGE